MPRKKVESKDVTPEGVAELGFFQCQELIHEIQKIAADNDGVIPDEQIEALVAAQTQAVAKLHNLCNFLKLLEAKEEICKERIAEIKETAGRAKSVRERVSGYLAQWVEAQGKTYHCDEYELKTRKSTQTFVPEGFDDAMFCNIEMKRVVTVDKKRVKEALEAGETVPGCELIHKLNLSIQ